MRTLFRLIEEIMGSWQVHASLDFWPNCVFTYNNGLETGKVYSRIIFNNSTVGWSEAIR